MRPDKTCRPYLPTFGRCGPESLEQTHGLVVAMLLGGVPGSTATLELLKSKVQIRRLTATLARGFFVRPLHRCADYQGTPMLLLSAACTRKRRSSPRDNAKVCSSLNDRPCRGRNNGRGKDKVLLRVVSQMREKRSSGEGQGCGHTAYIVSRVTVRLTPLKSQWDIWVLAKASIMKVDFNRDM